MSPGAGGERAASLRTAELLHLPGGARFQARGPSKVFMVWMGRSIFFGMFYYFAPLVLKGIYHYSWLSFGLDGGTLPTMGGDRTVLEDRNFPGKPVNNFDCLKLEGGCDGFEGTFPGQF